MPLRYQFFDTQVIGTGANARFPFRSAIHNFITMQPVQGVMPWTSTLETTLDPNGVPTSYTVLAFADNNELNAAGRSAECTELSPQFSNAVDLRAWVVAQVRSDMRDLLDAVKALTGEEP